ncbi:MAG: alpha/beta hydrolase [Maritimibacter sp.]
MTKFNPGLPKAEKQPRTLVKTRLIPLINAALPLAAVFQRGHERAQSSAGQDIWVYRPTEASGLRPALLWIHGGGLVIGHPAMEAKLNAKIRDRLNITVAAPRYRLGGKAPYPAAIEDLYAALEWLAAQPGVDPERIAIGGDSAGGGLAACLAIMARERGGPKVAFQLLHEPMLDEATRRRTDVNPEELRVWSMEANTNGWDTYLRSVSGAVPDTASAARVADPAGLPPAWVGVGTMDLFFDESVTYADRLEAAGVPVAREIVEGAYHGFLQLEPGAPVSRAYCDEMIKALGRGLQIDHVG